jgi:hypothetical protein
MLAKRQRYKSNIRTHKEKYVNRRQLNREKAYAATEINKKSKKISKLKFQWKMIT